MKRYLEIVFLATAITVLSVSFFKLRTQAQEGSSHFSPLTFLRMAETSDERKSLENPTRSQIALKTLTIMKSGEGSITSDPLGIDCEDM